LTTDIITIALDAMGGDNGASVVVPAALSFIEKDFECQLILVGNEEKIRSYLPDNKLPDRLTIHHASQEVMMDELPSRALRGKKDSSMRVAIDLVKSQEADACVSAGNTGALMATARFVLKMLPSIDRPAIISALPANRGRTWVLDLGANIDCSGEHLFQFAVMGSELVSAVDGIDRPTVGLLNIGQEEMKGNEQVKAAHALISDSPLNYVGYVEGDDIFMRDDIDIVVTDGFVGNIALKSVEGLAKMISTALKEGFGKNIFTKIAALISMPILKALSRRIDHRRYNGAALIGLKGIVVKSHGGTDAVGFANAIAIAKKEVKEDVLGKVEDKVTALMQGRISK